MKPWTNCGSLYGADMDTLVGEDANRNGILDPSENDDNQNGMLDPGVLEYVTVYSREPNTNRIDRQGQQPSPGIQPVGSALADELRRSAGQ